MEMENQFEKTKKKLPQLKENSLTGRGSTFIYACKLLTIIIWNMFRLNAHLKKGRRDY